jgi:hypothetical protein
MSNPPKPKLKFLCPKTSLSPSKLEALRNLSTDKLKALLKVGQAHSLKVRPDGTVLDGRHRRPSFWSEASPSQVRGAAVWPSFPVPEGETGWTMKPGTGAGAISTWSFLYWRERKRNSWLCRTSAPRPRAAESNSSLSPSRIAVCRLRHRPPSPSSPAFRTHWNKVRTLPFTAARA